jgi:hydrogenase maturation protease
MMSAYSSSDTITVIGIGNDFRHDDAAGLSAVRWLREHRRNAGRLVESDGNPMSLLELWKGADIVILIDAVASAASPGTIHWFDAESRMTLSHLRAASSHGLGVAQAIEMAMALGQMPTHMRILGIEGAAFEPGIGLSPEVADAIPAVASCIEQIIEDLRRPEPSAFREKTSDT